MKNHVLRMSFLIALGVVTASVAQAQAPASGDSRFVGKWELQIQVPAGASAPVPPTFGILEIAGDGATLSGKLTMAGGVPGDVSSVSVKNDELRVELRLGGPEPVTMTGRRVGDRLELALSRAGEPAPFSLVGLPTTRETLPAPAITAPPADRQAFQLALSQPPDRRAEALRQFLKDFPGSSMKEQATLQLAQSLATPDERVAALRQFIVDFPKSADEGYLQIAVALPGKADKVAGLRAFLKDHPDSPLKIRAESALKRLTAPEGDPASAVPVRVGGNIRPPVKLVDVKPAYPAEAQSGRVQGVVIIEAVIDTAGNVTQARVLRSIPLLDQAAIDAVTQWKFSATELDGAPVGVIMTVTVNFSMR